MEEEVVGGVYVCVSVCLMAECCVSRGGCVASTLWWSLGAAGLNYTLTGQRGGQENLCLTSETKLT